MTDPTLLSTGRASFGVAFLQNAYFPPRTQKRHIEMYHADPVFRRRVFSMSRSGSRLLKAFGEERFARIAWENCTTETGTVSSARFKPDPQHIKDRLWQAWPGGLVLTFGEVAEEALREIWKGDLICLPHPACRIVTNALFEEANKLITQWTKGTWGSSMRVAIRQRRGSFEIEQI